MGEPVPPRAGRCRLRRDMGISANPAGGLWSAAPSIDGGSLFAQTRTETRTRRSTMRILDAGRRPHLLPEISRTFWPETEPPGRKWSAIPGAGPRLSESISTRDTRLGARTQAALAKEQWDYVVLQEMSHGPITAPGELFRQRGAALPADSGRTGPSRRSMPPGPIGRGWGPAVGQGMGLWRDGPEPVPRRTAGRRRKTAPCLPTWGGGFTSCPARRTVHAADGVHPSRQGARRLCGGDP